MSLTPGKVQLRPSGASFGAGKVLYTHDEEHWLTIDYPQRSKIVAASGGDELCGCICGCGTCLHCSGNIASECIGVEFDGVKNIPSPWPTSWPASSSPEFWYVSGMIVPFWGDDEQVIYSGWLDQINSLSSGCGYTYGGIEINKTIPLRMITSVNTSPVCDWEYMLQGDGGVCGHINTNSNHGDINQLVGYQCNLRYWFGSGTVGVGDDNLYHRTLTLKKGGVRQDAGSVLLFHGHEQSNQPFSCSTSHVFSNLLGGSGNFVSFIYGNASGLIISGCDGGISGTATANFSPGGDNSGCDCFKCCPGDCGAFNVVFGNTIQIPSGNPPSGQGFYEYFDPIYSGSVFPIIGRNCTYYGGYERYFYQDSRGSYSRQALNTITLEGSRGQCEWVMRIQNYDVHDFGLDGPTDIIVPCCHYELRQLFNGACPSTNIEDWVVTEPSGFIPGSGLDPEDPNINFIDHICGSGVLTSITQVDPTACSGCAGNCCRCADNISFTLQHEEFTSAYRWATYCLEKQPDICVWRKSGSFYPALLLSEAVPYPAPLTTSGVFMNAVVPAATYNATITCAPSGNGWKFIFEMETIGFVSGLRSWHGRWEATHENQDCPHNILANHWVKTYSSVHGVALNPDDDPMNILETISGSGTCEDPVFTPCYTIPTTCHSNAEHPTYVVECPDVSMVVKFEGNACYYVSSSGTTYDEVPDGYEDATELYTLASTACGASGCPTPACPRAYIIDYNPVSCGCKGGQQHLAVLTNTLYYDGGSCVYRNYLVSREQFNDCPANCLCPANNVVSGIVTLTVISGVSATMVLNSYINGTVAIAGGNGMDSFVIPNTIDCSSVGTPYAEQDNISCIAVW